MEITENQQDFKEKIFSDMEARLVFCTKNERRQVKYEWLITAIESAKNQDWTKENFSELVFFYNHMHDCEQKDLIRLWKVNNFKTIF